MITAFLDESGTHQGSKVITVAAYIGDISEWASVEIRFRKADKHAGRPFHAVDCAQGGKAFHGIDKDKRARIAKKIIKVVNDHDIYGISWGAWIEDYAVVKPRAPDQRWEKWLQPLFTLVFQGVVVEAAEYVSKRFPGERMSLAVEESKHWYIPAAKKFLRLKHDTRWPNHSILGTIAPYSKVEAVQLYAPDVLAYEGYLQKTRERYPTEHGPRENLLALLENLPAGKLSAGRMLDLRLLQRLGGMWGKGEENTDTHLKRWHKQYAE